MNFSYPNFEIMLVDNSDDKMEFFERIDKQYGKKIILHKLFNFHKLNIRETIARSREIIRQYAIHDDFDYFLSLECDVFPPGNILEHLIALQRPVVSIPYFIGQKGESHLLTVECEPGTRYAATQMAGPLEAFVKTTGRVEPIFHSALGCTLIHKSVFTKVKFHAENPESEAFDDSYFYEDLLKLQIQPFTDFSIIAKHFNQDWTKLKLK
jgi:hypothetical protein